MLQTLKSRIAHCSQISYILLLLVWNGPLPLLLCRGMHTPTDKPKAKPELRSWHQLISAMLSTGAEVSDLFQPGHLAGADSPVHMAFVDPATQAQVVDWLVFIRFKKVGFCQLCCNTLHDCCIALSLCRQIQSCLGVICTLLRWASCKFTTQPSGIA